MSLALNSAAAIGRPQGPLAGRAPPAVRRFTAQSRQIGARSPPFLEATMCGGMWSGLQPAGARKENPLHPGITAAQLQVCCRHRATAAIRSRAVCGPVGCMQNALALLAAVAAKHGWRPVIPLCALEFSYPAKQPTACRDCSRTRGSAVNASETYPSRCCLGNDEGGDVALL